MALKRFVNGAESEPFFQKRAPEKRPDWIETVELRFPSGRTADEVVVGDEAALAWVINLGCIDLNPHPVRFFDLDHPDELRVDLDPVPGVEWPQIRDVALVARDVLADFRLTGWPRRQGCWTRCSTRRPGTRRLACQTRRGRQCTTSRPVRRPGSSRPRGGCPRLPRRRRGRAPGRRAGGAARCR